MREILSVRSGIAELGRLWFCDLSLLEMELEKPDMRLVRDLQWAIGSPFLMRGNFGELVATGERLAQFSERYAGRRVGYYFESLIYYWLKYEAQVEILAHGLQIMEGGRTVGELDFVFRDKSGRVCHWEVAAKFYLHCADRQVGGSHFIGPNARDTFERKRDKLLKQQLTLSERVFPEVTERVAFVKGRIFYHPLQEAPRELPDGMSADHLTGIWLHHADLDWLEAESREGDWSFQLVEKPFWLAPLSLSAGGARPLHFDQLEVALARHFLKVEHPVLISALKSQNGKWLETARLFVVVDRWPQV